MYFIQFFGNMVLLRNLDEFNTLLLESCLNVDGDTFNLGEWLIHHGMWINRKYRNFLEVKQTQIKNELETHKACFL